MTLFKKKHTKLLKNTGGFTIIELMVTIGIVVLVTGLVMIQYASFNSSVLLTSQAYLTAFDIRETQSLAVSVRGQGEQFKEDYGVAFNMATPDRYILFQDSGDQNPPEYDPGEEIGVPFKLDPRFTILNICGTNNTSRTCYTDDPNTTGEAVDSGMSTLDISFKRPDFDADFDMGEVSGIHTVEIQIGNNSSPIIKSVLVYSSGQISVE